MSLFGTNLFKTTFPLPSTYYVVCHGGRIEYAPCTTVTIQGDNMLLFFNNTSGEEQTPHAPGEGGGVRIRLHKIALGM